MAGMAGTAGVWRLAALNEAGGWKDRTTVEDMDLAVRASLKGWKFVYLGDVEVMIPSYVIANHSCFLYTISPLVSNGCIQLSIRPIF